jgi:copper(I)-binding protein
VASRVALPVTVEVHMPRTSAGQSIRLFTAAAVITAVACRPAPRGGSAAAGSITISRAVVSAPAGPSEAPAFLVLDNHGPAADSLIAVVSPDADSVSLHTVTAGRMEPLSAIVLPAERRVRLAPGQYHLMLKGLRRPLASGDTVSLELQFSRAGPVVVRAPVLRYSEAVSALH